MTGKPMVDQSNGTLQSRTGHLLPSPLPAAPTSPSMTSLRPPSGVSAVSSKSSHRADDHLDGTPVRKSHSHSLSSNPHTLASSKNTSKGSLSADNKDRQRAVRTLPPWVQSVEEDEDADPTSLLLPRTPTHARPAYHHYTPTPKGNVAGRHFDYARESTPVTITQNFQEHASKWQQFSKASTLDYRPSSSRGQVMDDEWIKDNLPDLEKPWEPLEKEDNEDQDTLFWMFNTKHRQRKLKRLRRMVMNHPMVPLGVRLTVLIFSCLALGLAGSIFHRSSDTPGCENNSSTWLAVIVDVVAIVYTTYITYDEYTSKPLGLRSHTAKMRLIFLDLLFIVFDSANLSLAFQALTDERWACKDNADGPRNACPFSRDICTRQKALTATLLIALVAWLMTFAISTLRLIERVAR
ncbi:hypothetical protein EJ04DRAFT_510828 [Polyplosphaeria fusca]|uniref:Regulator of phospholipase D SRF1 n=1 Tax=Polyplosphaeria fusca TaxID=682080 RepID=A0A9P4R154_9PLEO|nr:hypothetical protein EJ04DRAFT_510828 [Polyplosphaeria fusca]